MFKIGKINTLTVVEVLPFAYQLAFSSDDTENTVMLKESTHKLKLGDTCDVFIYTLADGSLEATVHEAKLQLDDFAALTLKGSHQHGYFFDWGLEHDLYAPEGQVHTNLDIGKTYVVRLIQDKLGKLVGTTKIERFLSTQTGSLLKNKAVELLIYEQTPLGYKAIVDEKYQGLLFKSDLITRVQIGDKLNGFIKQLRNDGKLDLSLQLQNKQSRKLLTDEILEDLQAHDGISSLTDKSSPQDIFAHFKVSKGAYKKAIGTLFKEKKIRIEKNAIYLVSSTGK